MEEGIEKTIKESEIAGEATWNRKDWNWDAKTMVAQQRDDSPINGTCNEGSQCEAPAPLSNGKDNSIDKGNTDNSRERKISPSKSESKTQQRSASSKGLCCQALDCDADIQLLSHYHRRNRICKEHIKASSYIRRGDLLELRFCQRCGYGHPLDEFDHKKHSCRAQLEKHNARRRKKMQDLASSRQSGDELNTNSNNSASQLQQGSAENINSLPLFNALDRHMDVDVDDNGILNDLSSWLSLHLAQSSTSQEIPALSQEEEHKLLSDLLPEFIADYDSENILTKKESSLGNTQNQDVSTSGAAILNDECATARATSYDILNDTKRDPFDIALALMSDKDTTENKKMSSSTPHNNTADAHASSATAMSKLLPTAPLLISPEARIATISLKLFGCTPAELPPTLRDQLIHWLGGDHCVASIETYLRPGCVHLTVQSVLDTAPTIPTTAAAATLGSMDGKNDALIMDDFIKLMLAQHTNNGQQSSLWHTKTLLVQVNADVALIHKGRLVQKWNIHKISISDRRKAVPSIVSVSPGSIFISTEKSEAIFEIEGLNIMQDESEIVARLHGEYVALKKAGCVDCTCAASIKSCCSSSPSVPVAANVNWEQNCCGCCISKLSSLSLASPSPVPPEQQHQQQIESSMPKACCSSAKSPPHKPPPPPVSKDVALQKVKISIDASSLTTPGILHVDIIKGPYTAPRGAHILIVDDSALVDELESSVTLKENPQLMRQWISTLGIIFEYMGDRAKLRYSFVERVAISLLYESICAGFIAIAQRLYSFLQSEIMFQAEKKAPLGQKHLSLGNLLDIDRACMVATFNRIQLMSPKNGLLLLHCAVASQRPALLDLVLKWSQDAGVPLHVDAKGPRGLTPLHLAVVSRDFVTASSVLLKLLALASSHCMNCSSDDDGFALADAWTEARDDAGASPADYAEKIGRAGLIDVFGMPQRGDASPLLVAIKSMPVVATAAAITAATTSDVEGWALEEPLQQPATPRRCKCFGPCPCAQAADPCACCISSDDETGSCGGVNGRCSCCEHTYNGAANTIREIQSTSIDAEMVEAAIVGGRGGGCCSGSKRNR